MAVICVGGASRLFPVGNVIWDKSVGDVAYASMVLFAVALVRPRARVLVAFAVALGFCTALECFQLTGLPAQAPRAIQIALGTTFAWHDMACYVLGTSLAAAVDAAGGGRTRSAEREH